MRILHPNTDRFTDYIDKGKFVMIWRITVFFVVVFLGLCISTSFYDKTSSYVYLSIFIIATICLIYLRFYSNVKPMFYVYSLCGLGIIGTTCNLSTGFSHLTDFVWGFSVIVFTFTTLGSRMGWFIIVGFSTALAIHFIFFYNTVEANLKVCTPMELVGISSEIIVALSVTGYFFSQHLFFTKFTEGQMSLANAELELQNQIIQRKSDENAVLVKEVHHRVKNNLQIIISLLRMHRDEVISPEARKDFDEAINRILSMALLHQQMYREKELSRFNLEDYIRNLTHDIIESYRGENQVINCDIHVAQIQLKLEAIVPLGLMINELLSNSLKHAFSNTGKGAVGISIENRENGFYMRYADDGTWVDEDLLVKGFGLELVHMLAEQLNGHIERTGSIYELYAVQVD